MLFNFHTLDTTGRGIIVSHVTTITKEIKYNVCLKKCTVERFLGVLKSKVRCLDRKSGGLGVIQ